MTSDHEEHFKQVRIVYIFIFDMQWMMLLQSTVMRCATEWLSDKAVTKEVSFILYKQIEMNLIYHSKFSYGLWCLTEDRIWRYI